MKRGFRLFFAAGALAFMSRAAVGCATNDDSNDEDPSGNGDDASLGDAALSPPDGAAVDARPDTGAPPNTCSADGWCYTSLPEAGSYDASALKPTLPGTTFELRSVWVGPEHRPWAVSKAGHVLRWDGTTWRVEAIVSGSPRVIWGWGTTDLWIGGERGFVLHGTVAGGKVTFQPVTVATTQDILRIVGTSATDVWAISDGVNNNGGILNRVFRLSAAGDAFVPMTVPGTFTESVAKLRLSALWSSGSEIWTAGYETVCSGPSPCKFQEGLVAMKWTGGADGGADGGGDGGNASWEYVPLLRDYSNHISAAAATKDGLQLVVIRDDGFVARIADDESKLDAGADAAAVTHAGDYAWTNEVAVTAAPPQAIWAMNRNDIWLVGESGVVRHFDGKGWQLVRMALTNVTPLLSDLHAIDAVVGPSGEQDIWVVGDDVALHRTVKP